MSKDLIDIVLDPILDSIFDDEWKGKRGEKLTERKLRVVSLFGRKGKVLRNVYLPKDDGTTSEVDVIFVTQKGIFVIESKNYSGWIFGDEKSKNWTAMLPNRVKNQFYNPVLQNKSHMKWMGKYVGERVPLFSVIVFSERCELKKINIVSEDIKVIKRDKIYVTIKNIWDKKPDILSEEQTEEIYDKLKKLTNMDELTKASHIENIEKKYKFPKTEEISSKENYVLEVGKKCPQCGGTLVLRTARNGIHAGKNFWDVIVILNVNTYVTKNKYGIVFCIWK